MNLEQELTTLLGPLVAGRAFRDLFPQPPLLPVWPAIRFQLIDGRAEPTICGTDTEETDDSTYQVDIVAATGQQANQLARQVVEAMQNFPLPTVRTARRNDPYDAPTKTFRVSLDFLISPSSD